MREKGEQEIYGNILINKHPRIISAKPRRHHPWNWTWLLKMVAGELYFESFQGPWRYKCSSSSLKHSHFLRSGNRANGDGQRAAMIICIKPGSAVLSKSEVFGTCFDMKRHIPSSKKHGTTKCLKIGVNYLPRERTPKTSTSIFLSGKGKWLWHFNHLSICTNLLCSVVLEVKNAHTLAQVASEISKPYGCLKIGGPKKKMVSYYLL